MQTFFRRALLVAATLGIAACGDTSTEPVTPTEVTLKLCGDAPAWFAYQDGDGAWTEVKGVPTGTAHTYTFTMTAPIGGVAVVQTLPCSTVNRVVYGTTAELTALYSGEQCSTSGLKTLTGSAVGGLPSYSSIVWLGGGFDYVYGESGNVTLEGVAPGPQDLVASRGSTGGTDKVIVRRRLDLADGATIPLLDFRTSEAIALDSATLSIEQFAGNGSVGGSFVVSSIYTANGGWAYGSIGSANATTWYRGLPASATITGDMHQIAVNIGGRYLDMVVGPIANLTVSVGPVGATPTVTTLSSATPMRMRMTTPVQAEYPKVASAQFAVGTRPRYYVNVAMTEAYRGSATSWILDVPDFGTSSGYAASWGLPAGVLRSWNSEVYAWDTFAPYVPAIGLTRRRAGVSGTSAAASAVPSFGETESPQLGRPTSVGARYEQLSCSS